MARCKFCDDSAKRLVLKAEKDSSSFISSSRPCSPKRKEINTFNLTSVRGFRHQVPNAIQTRHKMGEGAYTRRSTCAGPFTPIEIRATHICRYGACSLAMDGVSGFLFLPRTGLRAHTSNINRRSASKENNRKNKKQQSMTRM